MIHAPFYYLKCLQLMYCGTIKINVLWVFIPLFQHFYERELVIIINKPEELICSAKCENNIALLI